MRTDANFHLSDAEGHRLQRVPAVKKHIFYHAKNSQQAGELDITYYNAVYTVENALGQDESAWSF